MTTEFAKAVHAYVINDRQWPRHLRIAHAKMQFLNFTRKWMISENLEYRDAANFWRAVLKRNED